MLKEVVIKLDDDHELGGHINYSEDTKAWIIFAHGSGSSQKSKRNNWIAQELNRQGFATLLFDLLTPEEDDYFPNRFNIPLLAERLMLATSWLINSFEYKGEKIGYFGASTGAAAALVASVQADSSWPIYALVSRGGRPDLAKKENLNKVIVPTLLIVGGEAGAEIQLNKWAESELSSGKLVLVAGSGHLFEERGALEEVVHLTTEWFTTNLDHPKLQQEFKELHPR